MYALGIETSCDETSVSVVKDGKKILSNVIASSLQFHKQYGGVIPEIASRKQLEIILQVASSALNEAGLSLKSIGLICVTEGPGLLGSLLIGISFAKSLGLSLAVPVIGVDHVYSHIYANFLNGAKIKMPFIALVVSGGHTSLFFIKDFKNIELLGETQDDASGEAFDKVAKILGLGYPGGPLVERLAKKGNPKAIKFKCSNTKGEFDFSFSGIKTAVLYYVKEHICRGQKIADIAASFQEAVIDTLIKKSLLASELKNVNRLVVGGGVIANNRLREKLLGASRLKDTKCFFPSRELCTDNAAMVAGLGYQLYKKRRGV